MSDIFIDSSKLKKLSPPPLQESSCPMQEGEVLSVLRMITQLASEVIHKYGELSIQTKTQTKKLEREYESLTEKQSGLTRQRGSLTSAMALAALSIQCITFTHFSNFLGPEGQKWVREQLASQLQSVLGILTSKIDSDAGMTQSELQLQLQQLQELNTRLQSDAGSSDQMRQVLQAAIEFLKRASAGQ